MHERVSHKLAFGSSVLVNVLAWIFSFVWCPLVELILEPHGSGGFALSLVSLFAGLGLLVLVACSLGLAIMLSPFRLLQLRWLGHVLQFVSLIAVGVAVAIFRSS